MVAVIFANRHQAGKLLAKELASYKHAASVLAIPRGGVPIGFEIAKYLHIPLDLLVVRKIAAPTHPELGIGAVAQGNILILDRDVLRESKDTDILSNHIQQAKEEVYRQVLLYNVDPSLDRYKNKVVIIVDDGVATGITAKAAIATLKRHHPKQIIFAAPVCAAEAINELQFLVDMIVCVQIPDVFTSVGRWYEHFDQLRDETVLALLERSKRFSMLSVRYGL